MKTFVLVILLFSGSVIGAETIYRYTDTQGNVSFSDSPPADATDIEAVPPLPFPTEEEQRGAEQREAELKEAAGFSDEQRQAAEEQKRQVAMQQLRDALAALETAQVQRPEDWQHLADGDKHLKESYFERVDKAQRAVDRARKQLRALEP